MFYAHFRLLVFHSRQVCHEKWQARLLPCQRPLAAVHVQVNHRKGLWMETKRIMMTVWNQVVFCSIRPLGNKISILFTAYFYGMFILEAISTGACFAPWERVSYFNWQFVFWTRTGSCSFSGGRRRRTINKQLQCFIIAV